MSLQDDYFNLRAEVVSWGNQESIDRLDRLWRELCVYEKDVLEAREIASAFVRLWRCGGTIAREYVEEKDNE